MSNFRAKYRDRRSMCRVMVKALSRYASVNLTNKTHLLILRNRISVSPAICQTCSPIWEMLAADPQYKWPRHRGLILSNTRRLVLIHPLARTELRKARLTCQAALVLCRGHWPVAVCWLPAACIISSRPLVGSMTSSKVHRILSRELHRTISKTVDRVTGRVSLRQESLRSQMRDVGSYKQMVMGMSTWTVETGVRFRERMLTRAY